MINFILMTPHNHNSGSSIVIEPIYSFFFFLIITLVMLLLTIDMGKEVFKLKDLSGIAFFIFLSTIFIILVVVTITFFLQSVA